MSPIIHQIAIEYKAQLQQLYGNELAELILFGSYARGDYHEESDLDFAVILRDPNTRTSAEIARTAVISSRLSLKYGLMLSSLFRFTKSRPPCKVSIRKSEKKV
jgi:predicted nucleotidyltransferase